LFNILAAALRGTANRLRINHRLLCLKIKNLWPLRDKFNQGSRASGCVLDESKAQAALLDAQLFDLDSAGPHSMHAQIKGSKSRRRMNI
jgi:hypothetical protein